jgi:hypothetical protein
LFVLPCPEGMSHFAINFQQLGFHNGIIEAYILNANIEIKILR